MGSFFFSSLSLTSFPHFSEECRIHRLVWEVPSRLPASWEEEVNGETLVSRGHIGDGPRSLREEVSSDQGS